MSSYDWNEAPELIQSSLKRSAKAGEYIHRLGLEPMNGYGHIPRFSKGSLEKQFLMDARSAAKALADTHFHGRMKSLESVLSQHFVDELTAPILSHCGSLWVIPRTRREPSPCRGTLYPDRLDIDNPNHRARYI
jgi:hypothetical protein